MPAPDQWRIDTNNCYSKVVSTVISLATGSLVLPILFLREFLAVPKDKALSPLLNCTVYLSWVCFSAAILLGLIYSWLSAKWVKLAWNKEIMLSESTLERLLDTTFVGMLLLFLAGIFSIVWFFAAYHS
jgi:hypothetical protein